MSFGGDGEPSPTVEGGVTAGGGIEMGGDEADKETPRADALIRALSCSAPRLQEMGDAASVSIRERCDPQTVVEGQLAVRARIVDSGAIRSCEIPGNLDWLDPAVSERSPALDGPFSIGEITQVMIAAEDVVSGGDRVRSASSGLRALIGDPMRTGGVVLKKIRGKALRRVGRGGASR